MNRNFEILLLLIVLCVFAVNARTTGKENLGYITGGALKDQKTGDDRVLFGIWAIDGKIASGAIGAFKQPEFEEPVATAPGMKNISVVRGRILFNTDVVIFEQNPVPLRAHIEAGQHYHIIGELLFGNVGRYWVANTTTGERVSNVRFTPPALEGLKDSSPLEERQSAGSATLDTNGARFFTNKSTLHAREDCFTLFEEVHVDAIEQSVAVAMVLFSCAFAACGGDIPASKYVYRVYEPTCLNVTPGHMYVVVGERARGGFKYQIWDQTDKTQLNQFSSESLKLKAILK
jgi:hypothetical protein